MAYPPVSEWDSFCRFLVGTVEGAAGLALASRVFDSVRHQGAIEGQDMLQWADACWSQFRCRMPGLFRAISEESHTKTASRVVLGPAAVS